METKKKKPTITSPETARRFLKNLRQKSERMIGVFISYSFTYQPTSAYHWFGMTWSNIFPTGAPGKTKFFWGDSGPP